MKGMRTFSFVQSMKVSTYLFSSRKPIDGMIMIDKGLMSWYWSTFQSKFAFAVKQTKFDCNEFTMENSLYRFFCSNFENFIHKSFHSKDESVIHRIIQWLLLFEHKLILINDTITASIWLQTDKWYQIFGDNKSKNKYIIFM